MMTLPGYINRNATEFGDMPALTYQGTTLTWSEARDKIAQLAQGLSNLGVESGNCVAMMMSNLPEHWMLDQATVQLGGVATTLYATMPSNQIEFMAQHSGCVVAVLEGKDQVDRWKPILDNLPKLRHVVVLNEDALITGDDRFKTFESLLADDIDQEALDQIWKAIKPEDPATLIYTSGTTGLPKGVILTHSNVVSNVQAMDAATNIPDHFTNICFLPLAHIAERIVSLYMPIVKAAHVNFCPNMDDLMPMLRQVEPSLFFGVPRVWEKIAAGLRANPAAIPAHVGLGNVEWAFSAGAPLTADVQQYFKDAGISVMEGWGMTEATGVATTTSAETLRIGTVGKVIDGNETKLLEDGELLIRGPIVCAGYLQEDGSIVPAVDEDGWLHTGDIGREDEDGFLYIVDRKKELIITSGGKNVAPVALEALLKNHPLVGQTLVYGDREKYIVALVVLDPETAPGWAAENGVEYGSLAELSDHPLVNEEIQRAVDAANEQLARVEQVKKFRILPEEWTVDSGELTPSLKMKRRAVHEKYESEIQSMY